MVRAVEQLYKPTTIEEKLDRKNEMKARGTLLMALPNKDQLKFHSYQDEKLLMKAIKKRYGGNKESKKEMSMLTIKARRFIKRTGKNLDINDQKIGFDRDKEYGRKTMLVENLTENALIAQDGIRGYDWSYQAEQEHLTNFTLMALTSSGSSSNSDSENLEKAKKERDALKLTLEKYQNSSKSLNTLLESQTKPVKKNNFSPPIIEDWISNDESEVEFEPKVEDKNVKASIEKIKFVKTARETEEKQMEYKEKEVIDSGCSKNMTGNKCYLTDYEDYDGRFVLLEMVKVEYLEKVFFLITKDETSRIFKTFITGIENQLDCKVKVIRFDNGTEFKNSVMNQFCDMKRIKREFSIARTPQQNEAVNTACYVLNMALDIKPYNKTPYELIHGRPPLIDFMKPFGYLVTILNTKNYLGKFDEKANEGFFIGYSVVIVAGFQTNGIAGTKYNIVASQAKKKKEHKQEYILIPTCITDPLISQGPKDSEVDAGKKTTEVDESQVSDNGGQDNEVKRSDTARPSFVNASLPSPINDAGTPASTNAFEEHSFEQVSSFKSMFYLPHVLIVTLINDTRIFGNANDDEAVEEEVDMNNVVSSYIIPDALLTKFLEDQVIGSIETPVQTRQMTKMNEEHGLISSVQKLRRTNHKDFQNCLFACYLSQIEPKKPVQALKDPSWVEAMQDGLLQNKKDERGIVIKNKSRLVTQGHTQEEASRPDIIFAVCACTRFQVTPKTSHLHAMKRIFRYLKGQPKLGLWYPRDSRFDLEAYFDSDYAGASLNKKSTIGRCHFLGKRLISWQCKKQTIVENSTTKAEYVAATSCCRHVLWIQNQMIDYGFNLVNTKSYIDNKSTICIVKSPTTKKVKKVNGQEQIQVLVDKQKVIITEESIRRDHQFDDVEGTACLPNDTIFAELARMRYEKPSQKLTFYKAFFSPQFERMAKHKEIYVISSHTKKIFANIRRQRQGFSGNVTSLFKTMMVNAQEEVGKGLVIPVEESIPTPSNDPLPSGEDSIQLNELMIFYTNLQQQVLDLKEAKIALAKQFAKLKKRVKKLEKRRKSRPAGMKSLKKVGRMHDAYMFGVDELEGNEVFVDAREKIVEKEVNTTDRVTTAGEIVIVASVEDSVAPTTAITADVDDELTLENTLIVIKAAKPKVISTTITTPRAKGIVFYEQVQAHIPIVTSSKDKGKATTIELEKPFKKKDQIALDEEVERKLEAEMRAEIKEEERIAREKLAEQIQTQEKEQLTIKERSKLLVELIESRRKYFAAKRAKEIRNKPPTKARQKSFMCAYMRNIEGFKQKDFKEKSFDDIKKIFDKVYKRVNTFMDMDTENVEKSLKKTQTEGSSKRVRQELEKESAKKQKLAEQEQAKVADDDTTELKRCLEIVHEDNDNVAIKATPLSSKSHTIIDYKIYRDGKKSYFKIIRADRNSQNYVTFGTMFKNFNREDLKVLWSIVKEMFKKTNPVDDIKNLLFQTLKTMFKPHVKDII
uniref:Uncharacterized mitochondrial protein AtMg00810-like n=1 Tax=Tanacetum cinerariifolium TaxID=118510 RepID=A0A6L2P0F1_TANCI|nr:uncharacterized mitochondrial protein AtMg00810-like [Tanacetum cinerariifolium]